MSTPRWRKSSYSDDQDGNGACVEVADLGGGLVGVRDSKDPAAGQLTFSRMALSALVRGIVDDRLDPR
ncbi:MAG TPA: DUF397 domain-containing protein [Pseudonocardia sp.]